MASSWLRQLLDAGPPLPARGRYSDEEVARKLGIISGRVFMPGPITRGDAAAMALRMVNAAGRSYGFEAGMPDAVQAGSGERGGRGGMAVTSGVSDARRLLTQGEADAWSLRLRSHLALARYPASLTAALQPPAKSCLSWSARKCA
jgi:hypothetical protein